MAAILPFPGSGIPFVFWIMMGFAVFLMLLWCFILSVVFVNELLQSCNDGTINYSMAAQRDIVCAETSTKMNTDSTATQLGGAQEEVNEERHNVPVVPPLLFSHKVDDYSHNGIDLNDEVDNKEVCGEQMDSENRKCKFDDQHVEKNNSNFLQSFDVRQTETAELDKQLEESLPEVNIKYYPLGVTVVTSVSAENISKDDDSSTLCPQVDENLSEGHLHEQSNTSEETLVAGEIIDHPETKSQLQTNTELRLQSNNFTDCKEIGIITTHQEKPKEAMVVHAEVHPSHGKDIAPEPHTDINRDTLDNCKSTLCAVEDAKPHLKRELRMVVSRPVNVWELPGILAEPGYLERQFEQLPNPVVDIRRLPPGIGDKNRYKHVLPAPHSIVQISTDSQPSYINANFVRGCNGSMTAYIATQGPLKNTVEDFWHMILEYKCSTIIMNSTFSSENKIMDECSQYWSDYRSVTFGAVIVTTFDVIHCDGYIKRVMTVCDEAIGDLFKLTHYQLTSWPIDGGFMNSAILIDFLKKIDVKNETNPVVVHCSSGVDHTSIVIAVDQAIQYTDSNTKDDIDLMLIISRLRLDRPRSVTTAQQYYYIHQVVHDYVFTYLYGTQKEV